jgi:hypothetical protein
MLLIQYSMLFRGKLKIHSCRDVRQNRLGVVYCLYDVAELGLVCSFRVLICKPMTSNMSNWFMVFLRRKKRGFAGKRGGGACDIEFVPASCLVHSFCSRVSNDKSQIHQDMSSKNHESCLAFCRVQTALYFGRHEVNDKSLGRSLFLWCLSLVLLVPCKTTPL